LASQGPYDDYDTSQEVLTKLRHLGKRVRDVQEQQRKLSEKLKQLESVPVSEGSGEENEEEEDNPPVYESEHVGLQAITPVGTGEVENERMDGHYVVKLPFGVGYMHRSSVKVQDPDTTPVEFVDDNELVGRWMALAESFALFEEHDALELGPLGDDEEGIDKLDEEPEDPERKEILEGLGNPPELVPPGRTLLPSDDPSLLLFGSCQKLLGTEFEGVQLFEDVLPESVTAWADDKDDLEELEEQIQEAKDKYKAGNADRQKVNVMQSLHSCCGVLWRRRDFSICSDVVVVVAVVYSLCVQLLDDFIRRQHENMKLTTEVFHLRAQMGELKKAYKQVGQTPEAANCDWSAISSVGIHVDTWVCRCS